MRISRPLISVIVPVYQVEPFLKECVDSILNQSFSDFELILVDDGSTDAGGRICDDYAGIDGRVMVIHQENGGLSAARNTGIDHASGMYYTMVDSDDVLLCRDYLKFLYEAIVRNRAQISMCGLQAFTRDEEKTEVTRRPCDFLVCSGADFWTREKYPGFFPGCAYAKLYHRDLFLNLRYPVGRTIEDQAVIHRLVFPCETIVVLDLCMYGYRLRDGGIMAESARPGSDPVRTILDLLYAFEDRHSFFLEQGREDLARYAEKEMLYHLDAYHRRALTRQSRSS